jgi:hypothetical protein
LRCINCEPLTQSNKDNNKDAVIQTSPIYHLIQAAPRKRILYQRQQWPQKQDKCRTNSQKVYPHLLFLRLSIITIVNTSPTLIIIAEIGDTLTTAALPNDASELRSYSAATLSDAEYKIYSNNLVDTIDKGLKLRAANGQLGVAQTGATNISIYLNSTNANAVTVIKDTPI